MLLSEYRILTQEHVKTLLPELHEALVLKRDSDKLLVSGEGFRFKILFAAHPYLPENAKESIIAQSKNQVISDAVNLHRAFVSIHMDAETEPERRGLSREMLTKMVGALTDETTMAIWDTVTNGISDAPTFIHIASDSDDQSYLLQTDNMGQIGAVKSGELDAEIARARALIPDLISAVRAQPNEAFFVKMKFEEGDDIEHMWVEVVSIVGEDLTGILLNQPSSLSNLKEGDNIKKDLADLSDLVYADERGVHGPFTEKKVRAARQIR